VARIGQRNEGNLVMTMALELPTYIENVRAQGERLALLADRAMDRSIPGCPKWNGADLVFHMGRVHRMFDDVLQRSVVDAADLIRAERPDDASLLSWYREGLSQLVTTMTRTPRSTPAWSFLGPVTAEWVVRRLAHETAVHAADMAAAVGERPDIDLDLASDGIDEFLSSFFVRPRDDAPALDGSVHLHCTDVDGEWMVQPRDDGSIDIAWGHGKGDCALRGSANDLLMVLWRRQPLSSLEIFGDESLATRFVERAQL
jgi:uncharacterized protein (TIGR03083 family)